MVNLIVTHKNNAKTANTNKGKYRFEYVDEKVASNLIIIPNGRIGMTYSKKRY